MEWIVDGIVWIEADVLQYASNDLEVMKELTDVPWFVDGLTHNEGQLLLNLAANEFQDPFFSWALNVAEYTSKGDLRSFVLNALSRLGESTPNTISQLIAQPWISDGLDDDEAALLVFLDVATASGAEFNDVLRSYSVQSTTISLPLAGEVTIRAFREGPFPPGDNLLALGVDSARVIEELMGIPLQTTDIILIVDPGLRFGGIYSYAYLTIRNYRAVSHEIAHYYTDANNAPSWLKEGTAEFAQAYVNDRTGIETLDDRRLRLSQGVRYCKDEEMIANLSQLSTVNVLGFTCYYTMGEDFMHRVLDLIGLEAMQSVLRELYYVERVQTKNEQALHVNFVRDLENDEQSIYRTFLEHTQGELQEQFRELFRRLHGGPYSDPHLNRPDDHGDEAAAASLVTIGEAVEGGLDYEFDFDYFRFRAERGREYRIGVTHETLHPSSVYLYAPDGKTRQTKGKKSLEQTPSGPQMLWVPPSSGDYYFAVHNAGGLTGTYTLTITIHTPPADDHGDTLADATGIPIGEAVKGALDHGLDHDYFWFTAEANQGYRIYFGYEGGALRYHRLRLYYPDGRRAYEEKREVRGEANGQSYLLVPSTSQRRYFSIEDIRGAVAAYTVIVRREPVP